MNPLIRQTILLAGLLTGIFGVSARAQNLDQIGVTLLRTQTTNLDGSGIRVAQPEASAPAFEVNPASVGQPRPAVVRCSPCGQPRPAVVPAEVVVIAIPSDGQR